MSELRSNRSSRIVWLQVLTVLALLIPMIGGGIYAFSVHQSAQNRLSEIEPRVARLAGLLQRQGDMTALAKQANAKLSQRAYPVTQDISKAGNDAQQRIKTLFSESRLDIISIQVLPLNAASRADTKEDASFDRISIDLRVEGELSGIQNALSLLSAQVPLVLMDSMSIQTIGAVRPASVQRLGGQFKFSVLRVRA